MSRHTYLKYRHPENTKNPHNVFGSLKGAKKTQQLIDKPTVSSWTKPSDTQFSYGDDGAEDFSSENFIAYYDICALLYYFEQKVGVMKNLLWTLKCRGPMVITFLVCSHLFYDIFEIY